MQEEWRSKDKYIRNERTPTDFKDLVQCKENKWVGSGEHMSMQLEKKDREREGFLLQYGRGSK